MTVRSCSGALNAGIFRYLTCPISESSDLEERLGGLEDGLRHQYLRE